MTTKSDVSGIFLLLAILIYQLSCMQTGFYRALIENVLISVQGYDTL